MLIQRLVEHAATTDGTAAPRYHRSRAVRWTVRIDEHGTGSLIDRADSNNKAGAQEATPYLTRTSGIAAMLLVDTLEYVFGIPKDETDKAKKAAQRRNDAYLTMLHEWRDATADPVAATVCDFFDAKRHITLAAQLPAAAAASEIVAIMVGNEFVHRRSSAIDHWSGVARRRKGSGDEGICLACGSIGPLLKTVPDMVKSSLIPVGIDTSGRSKRGRDAALISVNTGAQGRGGVLQLANTPLCETCGSQAMAALNHLLGNERHRRRGDDSVLTWWLREPAEFDLMVIDRPELADVKALLNEVSNARPGTSVDHNAFHALTLSANQSRIVVRDWMDIPVHDIRARLAAWFNDHGSTDHWADGVHYVPLWKLVRASGRWNRSAQQYVPGSVAHGLERDLLRAALHGVPPPPHLVPRLLHRIRNDHHVDLPRVALLRLALTRPPYKENVMSGLDETEDDPAYVWGRIFAVLEAIQRRALPDVNATIRDRWFGLAMTQPGATLCMLSRNAIGHIKKLVGKDETRAAGRALDARLADLINPLNSKTGLPSHLDVRGQVRFIIGYNHQRSADLSAARAANAAKKAKEGDGSADGPSADQ
ncbi:type I-C CRISPR-associated protein Cas8c/Csd1 [Actinomadura graeca]|uniref:Type I-C CRISPR-associated protein Cas8c/Csd1 n=1 Tax=Actinomadura graeca TaxID=2750812 RepID=A0ABX8QVT9_9ACTN|nr:type I-C CRISPR-associated protein Cas8c/Csd1 [Actinomadura graeca]QXJ21567.1 type I-C CRISPR-associated protein Cas8c/Csd1 [Actinomadura graeca]